MNSKKEAKKNIFFFANTNENLDMYKQIDKYNNNQDLRIDNEKDILTTEKFLKIAKQQKNKV